MTTGGISKVPVISEVLRTAQVYLVAEHTGGNPRYGLIEAVVNARRDMNGAFGAQFYLYNTQHKAMRAFLRTRPALEDQLVVLERAAVLAEAAGE